MAVVHVLRCDVCRGLYEVLYRHSGRLICAECLKSVSRCVQMCEACGVHVKDRYYLWDDKSDRNMRLCGECLLARAQSVKAGEGL